MTAFQILQLLLALAGYVSRWVERAKAEKAFGDALVSTFGSRAAAAVTARAATLSVGLPDVRDDPQNRDNRDNV